MLLTGLGTGWDWFKKIYKNDISKPLYLVYCMWIRVLTRNKITLIINGMEKPFRKKKNLIIGATTKLTGSTIPGCCCQNTHAMHPDTNKRNVYFIGKHYMAEVHSVLLGLCSDLSIWALCKRHPWREPSFVITSNIFSLFCGSSLCVPCRLLSRSVALSFPI